MRGAEEIYEVPGDQYQKRMAFLNEVLELDSAFEPESPFDFGRMEYRIKFRLTDDDIFVEHDQNAVTVKFCADKVSVEQIISYTLETVHVKDMQIKDVEIEEIIKRLYRHTALELCDSAAGFAVPLVYDTAAVGCCGIRDNDLYRAENYDCGDFLLDKGERSCHAHAVYDQ